MRFRAVRDAVSSGADLSRFRKRPGKRLLLGMVLVALGILFGWPAVGVLGTLALTLDTPTLATMAAPAVYGGSWVVYLGGLAVGGPEALAYVRDIARWATRVIVQAMLGPTHLA